MWERIEEESRREHTGSSSNVLSAGDREYESGVRRKFVAKVAKYSPGVFYKIKN